MWWMIFGAALITAAAGFGSRSLINRFRGEANVRFLPFADAMPIGLAAYRFGSWSVGDASDKAEIVGMKRG